MTRYKRFHIFLIYYKQIFIKLNTPHIYFNKICNGVSFLKDYITERVFDLANYLIENKATVRQTAKEYGISKSTVHKDICERLPRLNKALAVEAKNVLEINKAERHIRGGIATREKYKRCRSKGAF